MENSKKEIRVCSYFSPCGKLFLGEFDGKLCLCDWENSRLHARNGKSVRHFFKADFSENYSSVLHKATMQLDEYFAGERRVFSVPVILIGTDFQNRVWKALSAIAYGQTESYATFATLLGMPKGIRAVAQAVGANKLSIIIPCHRVIGTDGSLTGFAGGLEAKRFLLEKEQGNKTKRSFGNDFS